jgi:ABC-type nitrate/sulfonate/bicarbonate transport system permease component
MFFGVFPIIIFTMSGTRNVSEVMLKVGRSLRLSRLLLFRMIVFPAILPSLVAGLRIGFGVTFLGIVLSQMFAARSGLGYVLVQSVSLHDMPRLYGLVLLLTLFAFIINGAFLLWERRLTRNRPAEKGAFYCGGEISRENEGKGTSMAYNVAVDVGGPARTCWSSMKGQVN